MPTYGFDGTVDEVAMAKMARYAGADYGVETSQDWLVTAVAGADRTVAIAGGTGYGHFVLDDSAPGDTKQLDTITSGKRWDLITRRRNWQPPGGTSAFAVAKGVAATDPAPAIPAARLRGPGVQDDQPIALVQITSNTGVPAQIIDLRYWPTMVYNASSLLALPDAKLGAEAIIGADRWHRELDSGGNPTWVSTKTSTQTVTTSGMVTPFAGGSGAPTWVVDSGFVNRCIVDATGKDVTYEVELRCTVNPVSVGSSGALSDIQVATLNGPLPDANLGNWAVPVTFRAIGGSSTSQKSGIYAHGYLTPAGKLFIDSGIPGDYIVKQANAGDWSVQALIRFRRA